MKRPIQLISVILVALLLGASFFSGLSEMKVDAAAERIAAADIQKHKSYMLADEFRQSTDDLTRMARLYAVTGKVQYIDEYQLVRAIRSGEKERPPFYNRPYWDFLSAGVTPPEYVSGDQFGEPRKVSLQEMMVEIGFTDQEMSQLNAAIDASEQLVQIELQAINAVQGIFKNDDGEYAFSGVPDLDLAEELMFSDAYLAEKAKISAEIAKFYDLLEARLHHEVELAHAEKNAAGSQALIALAFLALISVAVGVFLLIFCVRPLGLLSNAMQALAKGKTETEIPCQNARSEFGILARQIGDYKAASDKIAEMGDEARASREAAEAQKETALQLQGEMDKVVENAMAGDFTARVKIDSKDEATTRIANGMNSLMGRLDEATLEVVKALRALGDGDVETPMDLHGEGRFMELEDTSETARHRLGELIQKMTESTDEARRSQENVLKQQEVSQRLQAEIDTLLDGAQHGCFDQRITLDTDDANAKRIASGLNNLMDRYDETISELVKLFSAFGSGDLTAELSLASEGRFGELKESADTARALLVELIEQTTGSANEVLDSVNRVRSDSVVVAEAMQSQAASIEQTSAATVEMNQAVRDSASSLNGATDLAKSVTAQAQNGSQTVEQVIEAVEEIKKRADKIASFVSIIENISFQTNLLALNASVEAARAGEAGRGFAVVASEVRNLSLKASDAATEIADLIHATSDSVENGVSLSRKSGDALADIAQNITKLEENMAKISTTSDMQATSFHEIRQAIGEINDSTQRTAASADCTAEVADSLVRTSEALKMTLSRFVTSRKHASAAA